MRSILIIAVVIILMVLGKKYILDGESTDSTATAVSTNRGASALPVDVYVAREIESANTVYASGTVLPNEEVALQSEASGRLIQLNIREGSYVQKGELIAKIDDSDLQAQLRKLNFEEELAKQIEARQKKLLDIDAISKEEYDIAVNNVNTLSADKELLQVNIQKTEVRAPFGGYIGFKNISIGTYLTPGVNIATLVQSNPAKIDFSIPEKYASLLKVGQVVTFEVDGIEETFESKVVAIDPKVDEDLRTLRLRGITSNADRRLLPGMFVRLTVPLGKEEVIMVPTDAIVPILKGKMVYVMRNGKAMEQEITTGIRTDQNVQVRSGLSVGDSVIVSALMSLKAGMDVKSEQIINLQL